MPSAVGMMQNDHIDINDHIKFVFKKCHANTCTVNTFVPSVPRHRHSKFDPDNNNNAVCI